MTVHSLHARQEAPSRWVHLPALFRPPPRELNSSACAGFVNTSFFMGKIDYQPIVSLKKQFWSQRLTCASVTIAACYISNRHRTPALTVQNNSVAVTKATNIASIDTGTNLVGGPANDIAKIYAQVPGSKMGTGGNWMIPCGTEVTVSMSFGGPQWQMSAGDFNTGIEGNESMCVGAFFSMPESSVGPPYWVVGDSFLKNVYSVFRFKPPAVGFAQLSPFALSMNGVNTSALGVGPAMRA